MKNQNQKKRVISTIDCLGKLPPQAIDIEEAVLGAMLIESNSIDIIEPILKPNDFYDKSHEIIYQVILNLRAKRSPVDLLTVTQELTNIGKIDMIGGPFKIADLSSKIYGSSHTEFHANIIRQKSISRKVISLTSLVQDMAYDETIDIVDTIEEMEKKITELTSNDSRSESLSMSEAIRKTINKAVEIQEKRNKGVQVAISTGLESLDHIFSGGWRSPDLIILGARPSMGKTQHALSFAKNAAINGKHVFFASLEMTETQLINRYLLEDERINSYNLRTGQLRDDEWNAIDEMAGQLWNLPIHISGDSNIRNLNVIRSEARRLKRKNQLDIMFVDYLGLIKTGLTFQSRYLEVGYITGELKNLAKELDIPIICLSQLNRPIKGAAIKDPQLEDLRESGDIEQDADIVIFIHKPDYYDPDAVDSNGNSWNGRGKLIISKYREGARNNTVIFNHDERYKKIYDWSTTQGRPF